MATSIEKQLEKINKEVHSLGFASVGEAMVSMQNWFDRMEIAKESGGNQALQDETVKINNELRTLGFNSVGEAYGNMQEKIKRIVKVQRDGAKAEGVIKRCGHCHATGEKRCSGKVAFLFGTADANVKNRTGLNIKGVSVHMGTRLGPGTAQFVVKVQISLKGGDAMLVYNKERDVQYQMSMSSPLGRKLKEEILRNDLLNIRKGYFYSILREGKNYINPKILPPEIW